MSLNTILRWLKPRELAFFDLLEASASNLVDSANLFNRAFQAADQATWAQLRIDMKDLEHKGDEITHEIIDRLNLTFVTPIEREDILALAHALDDVVDCMYALSERLTLYKIDRIPTIAKALCEKIPVGARELVPLITSLRDMKDMKEIRDRIHLLNEIENQSDALYHAALAELFDNPSDAILVMKWREILGLLEDTTDRVELVAKVVGSTVMRNA